MKTITRTPLCERRLPSAAIESSPEDDSEKTVGVTSRTVIRSPGFFRDISSCWKLFSTGMGELHTRSE